jgi:hypothetical protein
MTTGKGFLALALLYCGARLLSAEPRIFEISTNSARIGGDILIYGDDFSPPEAQVLIGGAEAKVIAGNVAYLQVRVPGGALPGPITISQNGKVASSSAYFNPLPATPGILTNLMGLREINRQPDWLPIAVVADLDGDSRQDFVAARQHSLEIFQNKGGVGELITTNWFRSISLPVSQTIYGLTAADLDGDGKPELISSEGEILKIRENLFSGEIGTNSFGPALQIQRNIFGPVRVADMDHDGQRDILAVSAGKGIQVFWNRTTGPITTNAFTNTFVITSKSGMKSQGVRDFDVADLNQDGHVDIAAIVGTNLVVFALQDESGMLRTNFISGFILGPAFETYYTPYLPSFAIADINGDGVPDIVVRQTGAIVAYINHSTPDHIDSTTFQKTVLITSSFMPIVAGDFDGDGHIDLLVDNRFLYKLKTENGAFVALTGRERTAYEPDALVLTLGDFNGDNRPDAVAISNLTPRPLVILQNFGAAAAHLRAGFSARIPGVRELNFSGPPMVLFHLESSTDLIQWAPMTDLRVNAGGEVSYSYTDSAVRKQVFYRVRQ